MRGIKFIKTGVASLLIAAGAFVAVATLDPTNSVSAAKCSTNDVIDCGVTSLKQLRDRYNSDYTKGTKAIYSYFGITSDVVNRATAKQGTLYRDGRVVVDGKTVATGAHTVGRNHQPGSAKHTSGGYTFYSGPADVRFVRDVRPVYVFFDQHGRYMSAVMLDCGNPVVKAKPTAPKPTYECKSLTATKVTRTKYDFKTTVTTSGGAKATSFAYDFGDGTKRTSTSATISHTYSKPGTYTAKVVVTFKANGVTLPATNKVTCIVKITVKEEPKPEPKYIDVCVLKDKKYPVRIKEEDFDSKLHSKDPKDCEDKPKPKYIKVCRLEDNKYPVTIKEEDFDETLHSLDPEDCKDEPTPEPEMVKVCDPKTGEIIEVKEDEADKYLPVDSKKCENDAIVCDPETGEIITVKESDRDNYLPKDSEECKDEPAPEPEPPVKGDVTELPQTGLAQTISGIAGLGAITTATYYYVASRRNG